MSAYAAVVLAAGQSTRYRAAGGREPSKLLAQVDGIALVRRVVRAALASEARPVIVVTGHASEEVAATLASLRVSMVHNPAYADGLSTSLRCGLAAVPAQCAGMVVLLADMPDVDAFVIDALIARARACPSADAVVPRSGTKRGNPVLLARSLFPALIDLQGDVGARFILEQPSIRIEDVDRRGSGIHHDIDEPSDLLRDAGKRP